MRPAATSSLLQRLLELACLLVVGLCVSGAWAQEDPARQQFRKAQEFYDAGDFALALPLFEEALKTSSSPNARLYVARTLRELGRLTEAHDQFHLTFEESSELAKNEEKYAPTRDAAAAELARVQERVARVVIALPEQFAAASVTINDRALTPDELGRPLAFEPGEAKVHVELEGTSGFDKTVELAAGQLETVAVTLTKNDEPKPEPKPPPPPKDSPGIGTIRAAGIAVAGLGVAGLVVMGVTGSMAQSKKNQLADECGGVRCTDPASADVVDDGKRLKLIANVMLGVGAALTAAGIAMIIFGGPEQKAAASSAWLAPAPLPGGGAVTLGGSF